MGREGSSEAWGLSKLHSGTSESWPDESGLARMWRVDSVATMALGLDHVELQLYPLTLGLWFQAFAGQGSKTTLIKRQPPSSWLSAP